MNQGELQTRSKTQMKRPGAMTMAMNAMEMPHAGPKALRVGLIQNGKIVEERIVRKRETVSIGSSEKNHFVVQAPGMPSKFDLFQIVDGAYVLNFTEHMRGRVGLPSGVQDIEQLRAAGTAKNMGGYWQIALSETSRGKVVIGDITFLFQFVVPPPVQPKPQLPAAATGGVVKDVDWTFTAFVLFSFMVHFGLVVYLDNADWPMEAGIDQIPRNIAGMIFAEPPPPEEEKPEETTEEAEAPAAEAKEAPKAQASEAKTDSAPKEDVATSAEARAKFAEEAAQAAEAMLLSGLGGEDSGLADVVAQGAVTGNAEDVLAQAAGVGVARGDSGSTLRTRSGGGDGSGLGGLGGLAKAGAAGEGMSEGGAIKERSVRGRINLEDGGDVGGSGEFDAAVVVKMIKTRIRAIQICYEKELARNPTLQGKVVVQFTIQPTGSVTNASATTNTTNDPNVASCVVSTISRFRFNDPAPEGGSVTFSYPFVFAPQN